MTQKTAINPWSWQHRLGFSQAIEVRGDPRIVYCAGQTSVDGNGSPLHPHDMPKQINQALDNLEVVLRDAGLTLGDIIRLNYYTTDMAALARAAPDYQPRLAAAACKPAATALGITALFHPDLLIEIEATAVASNAVSSPGRKCAIELEDVPTVRWIWDAFRRGDVKSAVDRLATVVPRLRTQITRDGVGDLLRNLTSTIPKTLWDSNTGPGDITQAAAKTARQLFRIVTLPLAFMQSTVNKRAGRDQRVPGPSYK